MSDYTVGTQGWYIVLAASERTGFGMGWGLDGWCTVVYRLNQVDG